MSRGGSFKPNRQGIRRSVKQIGRVYEQEWRRHGPKLPLEPEPALPPAGWDWGSPEPGVPMPTSRLARVRREFLGWFAHHGAGRGWRPFLEEVVTVDDEAVTEDELTAAIQRLLDDSLLDGPGGDEQRWPALLQLTADGRRCVQDFDADTIAWARYHRPGGAIYHDHRDQRDQRVYADGVLGPVTAHSPGAHVEQNVTTATVDVRGLRRAARFLLENLDDLADEGFDVGAREQLRERGADLIAAAEEPEPDHGRLRELGERLNTTLLTHPVIAGVASGATSGTFSGTISGLLAAALGQPS